MGGRPAVTEHDAAYLRLVFNELSADHAQWCKNPMAVWQKLYEAVRDTEGGLYVLKTLQEREDEIAELTAKIDALNAELAKHRPKQLEVRS